MTALPLFIPEIPEAALAALEERGVAAGLEYVCESAHAEACLRCGAAWGELCTNARGKPVMPHAVRRAFAVIRFTLAWVPAIGDVVAVGPCYRYDDANARWVEHNDRVRLVEWTDEGRPRVEYEHEGERWRAILDPESIVGPWRAAS